MPRGDGSGPAGMGPMTGRSAGFCAGNNAPGFQSALGFGRGRGRGFRNRFWSGGGFAAGGGGRGWYGAAPAGQAWPDMAGEKEMLRTQAQGLERSLNAVQQRLSDLEKQDKE